MISVLLPAWRAGPYIAAAVADVLGQVGVELELIAVHQGPDDDTWRALHAVDDPRLRLLRLPDPDTGAALEHARRHARFPWLARMDADDRCPSDRLHRQLAAAQETGAQVIACQVQALTDDGGPDRWRYLDWHNRLLDPEQMAAERFVEAPYLQGAALIAAAAVDQVGGWRPGTAQEDYDLLLRLFDRGVAHHKVPLPLYQWRIHQAQHSRQVDPNQVRALKATHLSPLLKPDAYVAGVGRSAASWAELLGLPVVAFDGRDCSALPPGQPICVFGNEGVRSRVRAGLRSRGLDGYLVA
jgi:glycosyltransferase involved in cell wall biosynthesis